MNRRINKKIHSKYLSDIGIEISKNEEWGLRFSQLDKNDIVKIEGKELPNSFYELNPLASKYKLSYEVKRVEFNSIPISETSWWQVDEKTIYLKFYPSAFLRVCWYVAINFQSQFKQTKSVSIGR